MEPKEREHEMRNKAEAKAKEILGIQIQILWRNIIQPRQKNQTEAKQASNIQTICKIDQRSQVQIAHDGSKTRKPEKRTQFQEIDYKNCDLQSETKVFSYRSL